MTIIPKHAILLAPLFLAWAAAQTPPAPKDEKCSLEGRVVNAAGSDPIRKASLTLASSGTPMGATKTETDDEGRFAFRDLDPGRYTLTGEKAGFARQAYGARSNPGTGSALILAKGQQTKDLVLKLTPAAVITGRVLDEDGEPVANAIVMASKTLYQHGEPQLTPVGSAGANEMGEYRIGGLSAGSYVLAATNRTALSGLTGSSNKPAGEGPERDYVTTYYPNSVDPASAVPVQVAPGAEMSANIRLAKADTVRVGGKVSGALEGKQVLVLLVPKSAGSMQQLASGRSAAAKPDGSFEIAGVTSGAYTLTVVSEDMSGMPLFSSQGIQVGKERVEGVAPRFAAAGEITGAVAVDGPAPAALKSVKVTLVAPPGAKAITTPMAAVGDDGKFILKSVPSARYLAEVSGAPETAYVKSVKLGGQDTPDEGFDLAGGAAGPLQIRLSLSGAEVSGAVRNADDNPQADATVVLMPDSRRASLYRETRTGKDGSFSFKGVAPGDYKALAWEDVETAAYKDPEYLNKVGSKAEALSLKESDRKSISLKVISWQ
jgi:protocatechuate 3,4-dioxygenase beta subunit